MTVDRTRVGIVVESRRAAREAAALVRQLRDAGLDASLVGAEQTAGPDVLFAARPAPRMDGIPAKPCVWTWGARRAGSALEVLLASPEGTVVGRACIARSPVSERRNRQHASWKAVDLLIAELRHPSPASLPDSMPVGDPFRVEPLHLAGALARRQLDWRLRRPEGFVAYRRQDGLLVVLQPPYGDFFADPFPIEHEGTWFVLFEHLTRRLGHGTISYVELGADGLPSEPRSALRREHHLSYPFLFTWEGGVYMVPSTRTGIEVYRAESVPDRWQLVHTAFEGVEANDPTLLFHEGRVWLFANVLRPGARPNEELHLFSSGSPFGEWRPHPGNPVVSDVRSARPAGAIVERDDALIRPGQDCSIRYGYATVLNRIETLTETDYREVPVGRIEPSWLPGMAGTHTYNAAGGYELVDGYRFRLRRPSSQTQHTIAVLEGSRPLVEPIETG